MRKNYGTSAGARKGWRTRRAAHGRRKGTRGATKRRGRRLSTTQRLHAKRSRAARKAARTRASRRVARHMQESMSRGRMTANGRRRRRHRRNAMVENPRRRSRRRKAAKRPVRRHRRRHTANRRRRSRRHTANRQHRTNRRRYRANRRHHSNRRRHYRRNIGGVLTAALKSGVFVAMGLVAGKLLGGVVRDQVLARITGSVATATPPAASGLEALQPYNGLIASAAAAAIGAFVTNKFVKDPTTRNLLIAGMGAGFVHTALVFALDKLGQPKLVAALSGDATATRLSAMYGVGAAASIEPRYAPIGEYFSSGVGEYFSSGVGAYESNADIYQAAAGVGADDNAYGHSNHVMPGSNLDRELSIAEAAAGVGAAGVGALQPYEAAAGFGEYFSDMSGLGAVGPVASRSTWIPGQSDPQLWAGTRAITRSQASTAMQPAGLLETAGGQGIFG
jgi:hypothetical protein